MHLLGADISNTSAFNVVFNCMMQEICKPALQKVIFATHSGHNNLTKLE